MSPHHYVKRCVRSGFPRLRGDEPTDADGDRPGQGFPRLRGDEPAELSGYAMKDEFSPPTRG